MGIKRPTPRPKSDIWIEYIEQGQLKDLLLGKGEKFFHPDDGKSMSAISDYRWYHDRWFVMSIVFNYFSEKDKYDELNEALFSALNELKEDPFVLLNCLVDAMGNLFYSLDKNEKNQKIYVKIHLNFKRLFSCIENMPEKEFNIPDDYPGQFEKIKFSLKKYFKELDQRCL